MCQYVNRFKSDCNFSYSRSETIVYCGFRTVGVRSMVTVTHLHSVWPVHGVQSNFASRFISNHHHFLLYMYGRNGRSDATTCCLPYTGLQWCHDMVAPSIHGRRLAIGRHAWPDLRRLSHSADHSLSCQVALNAKSTVPAV